MCEDRSKEDKSFMSVIRALFLIGKVAYFKDNESFDLSVQPVEDLIEALQCLKDACYDGNENSPNLMVLHDQISNYLKKNNDSRQVKNFQIGQWVVIEGLSFK